MEGLGGVPMVTREDLAYVVNRHVELRQCRSCIKELDMLSENHHDEETIALKERMCDKLVSETDRLRREIGEKIIEMFGAEELEGMI